MQSMQSAQTRGVGFWLSFAWLTLLASSGHAQAERGALFVRLQLEPGVLLARQNGPLTLGLNALGLGGSLAVGLNVSRSTAVGVEAWMALALLPSMDITAPDFDGAGQTAEVQDPMLTAMLVGPHITHVFERESFSLSATAGISLGQFDYGSYDETKLPYNSVRTFDPVTGDPTTLRTPIELDETNVGWGFGVSFSKLIKLSDGLALGVGAQFRYLSIPDDAVYFDDDELGPLRYRADTWSVVSFGANVGLMYF